MTSWPSLMSTSRSVIFERAKFNKRIQLHGKTLEQYITTVYHLAYTCNFGNLNENLIRDRLIVGIRDQSLSQQLQMDPNLTLEKAKKRIRQKEVVRQQSDIFKGKADKPVSDLEGVRYKHKFNSWDEYCGPLSETMTSGMPYLAKIGIIAAVTHFVVALDNFTTLMNLE